MAVHMTTKTSGSPQPVGSFVQESAAIPPKSIVAKKSRILTNAVGNLLRYQPEQYKNSDPVNEDADTPKPVQHDHEPAESRAGVKSLPETNAVAAAGTTVNSDNIFYQCVDEGRDPFTARNRADTHRGGAVGCVRPTHEQHLSSEVDEHQGHRHGEGPHQGLMRDRRSHQNGCRVKINDCQSPVREVKVPSSDVVSQRSERGFLSCKTQGADEKLDPGDDSEEGSNDSEDCNQLLDLQR
jgi:hypothetical protein